MRSFIRLLLLGIVSMYSAVSIAADATSASPQAKTTTDTVENEQYTLEIVAPKVDNNVFPVAIKYFDDLISRKTKLKGYLQVPVKLTIDNPKRRRLMVIYTTGADEEPIKFGTPLRQIAQVQLAKSTLKKNGLVNFLPDSKNYVYRMNKSKNSAEILFNLNIIKKHFHDGNVKVHIASTNGVELTELCFYKRNCTNTVTFSIIPREVRYSSSIEDQSTFETQKVIQTLTIKKANIDIAIHQNNKMLTTILRDGLPKEVTINHETMNFNPNIKLDKKFKSDVSNIDMYPIIHYMSNKRYVAGDSIIFTNASNRPDINVINKQRGTRILNK